MQVKFLPLEIATAFLTESLAMTVEGDCHGLPIEALTMTLSLLVIVCPFLSHM